MRLSRQFQVYFFFFTKKFRKHRKHQNVRQMTFTLLEVCACKKLLPLLFSICLILFWWLIFACECFCACEIFSSKYKQAWNCLDNLILLYYSAQWQTKLTDFGASSVTTNLNQKLVKAELLFSGFLVEHNLHFRTADHTANLFKIMFSNS